MKKKTKKILFSILGVIVLVVGSFGIAIALDCSNGGLSGTIVTNVQEGYGQDEWRHYDVDIPFGGRYSEHLYTNEDGDYISNIAFGFTTYYTPKITYDNYFNIADDFEAFFVLSNMKEGNEAKYYQTEVETTHWFLGDYIDIPPEDLDPNYDASSNNHEVFKTFHIIEVWIRTVD